MESPAAFALLELSECMNSLASLLHKATNLVAFSTIYRPSGKMLPNSMIFMTIGPIVAGVVSKLVYRKYYRH